MVRSTSYARSICSPAVGAGSSHGDQRRASPPPARRTLGDREREPDER